MTVETNPPFRVPDIYLAELPTGSVKTVVHHLGRTVARGEFPINSTIPKEAELVQSLGVSRTVVREAIKVLSGKGMLRTARRYGTKVLPFEQWNLLDPDVINWHEPGSPAAARIFRESTELRLIVEPSAAALAAEKATLAQKETILKAARHISPEYGDEAMIAAEYAFHATILEGTDNTLLRQLQGLILAILQFSYAAGKQAFPNEKVSRRNHVSVAEAILASKPEDAANRMRKMLGQNRKIAKWITAGAA